ncbi:cell division protein FtsA [Candidatus Saccharibacteria bacterium]|nr:cell division protein FtsA [Candidatus Saccharibacteria bacterium]
MQDVTKYAVGLDVGTDTVKAVVGQIDENTLQPTILGVSTQKNSGMRKGVVVNLSGPAKAIDETLGEVERMSGYEVNEATLSINGAHILSTKTDGMIAVGTPDHEINPADLDRIDDVAATGKIPANREILELIPYSYRLDGQENIKDPLGMVGARLEIQANVVSALKPHCVNVEKAADMASVKANKLIVAVVAAARAVLNEKQLENGVCVIDMGAATTSLAVFEEGDLQFASVIPIGSNNITNDLAMGLKTNPEVAEEVKKHHVSAMGGEKKTTIEVKQGKEEFRFKQSEIDEIVSARLDEIFDYVQHDLKKSGYDGKLPEGIVLVGGGANLKDIVDYVKNHLQVAAKIGDPGQFVNVADEVKKPEFAVAVGLMLNDIDFSAKTHQSSKKSVQVGTGWIKKLFGKFKV